MPTMGLELLIRGEATGPSQPEHDAPVGRVSISQPTPGTMIGPRVEVRGTAPPNAFLVIDTEVRAQDNDELLKVVPGIRHSVPASGNWHFAIAAPQLPDNVAEPLYYVIRAYTASGGPATADTVKVFRPGE
jgi:hypothetical protein